MLIHRSSKLVFCICLGAAMCAAVSQGQDSKDSSKKPVAYVFVSSATARGKSNMVHVYGVKDNGRLTRVEDSPFQANDNVLSVNGDKLYGINQSGTYIDAYSIAEDGALRYLESTDYASYNPYNCGAAGWIFPDRTGANLYAMNFNGDCANNTVQSFRVKDSAELTFLGSAEGGAGSFSGVYLPLSFLGNNRFGFEAVNNGCLYYSMWGFERTGSGDLNSIDISAPMPPPPPRFSIYIPMYSAASPSNYVAVAMEAAVPPGCKKGVPIQIGSFTADSHGDLSTVNTYETMPDTAITIVNDMKISPSGALLAVGGVGGLQIFHFNGAHPPTHFTGVLTTDAISQLFWDNANHLYALSQATGKLRIYTVTPDSFKEAPGSPNVLSQALNFAVQAR